MRITPYTTPKLLSGKYEIFTVLAEALPSLQEKTVVAVSSKIVALCEGRTVPIADVDKDALIAGEAEWYLPRSLNRYNVSFTITHGMLVPTAGIDESNGNGHYVLWPQDPQASANAIRAFLAKHFNVQDVGVVLTDSMVHPLRWGVTGIAIASSGFEPVKDCIGAPDLFGRKLQYTKESVQDGLAAAASLVMGEGAQQTPLAVIEDVPFVSFTRRDPTAEELAAMLIAPADDLFGPFLTHAPWKQGSGTRPGTHSG